MKTWDIFLIISLGLTAIWCIYVLIAVMGFDFKFEFPAAFSVG